MNLSEFSEKYKNYSQKNKIIIYCDACGKECNVLRASAENNIKKHGKYLDRSCCTKIKHQLSPMKQTTKEKISCATKGRKFSEKSRRAMSESKKKFYRTPEGEEFKKRLSRKTAEGHKQHKYVNSVRQGWYFSAKNKDYVFYGSSYELRYAWELDRNPDVKSYQTQVSFTTETGRGRCLDFLVEYYSGKTMAVEIKSQQRINEQNIIEQIDDTKEFAIKQNYEFRLITEKDLGLKTYHEIKDWADKFKSNLSDADFQELRKKKNREKANKHYHNKIAKDTVEVYCDYCKETHEVLRKNYVKNVEKNKEYICERHGGHIAGKKPKKKKVNPYAAEGKKQCSKCKAVKKLEEFGKDKSRSDGHATRCKKCRAEIATAKYRAKISS